MNIRDLQQEDGQPPSADQLAGEYVLGVLDAAERGEAEQRIGADPGFARLVTQWEQRLAPLLEEVGSAPLPAHVWLRVRRELGWATFDAAPAAKPWKRTGFWQGATALAAALALVAVLTRPVPEAPLPTPVATTPSPAATPEPEQATRPVTPLLHDDGRAGWLASVDATLGKVLMVPVPSAPDPQGRAPELWLIPAGGAPLSLGLVSNDRAHTVDVPAALRAALVNGSVLAITLEPAGGAPHPAPSGPVVAKGDIANL